MTASALVSGDFITAAFYNALILDAQIFDGICDASGGGHFTTLQAMDDELDASSYLGYVRPGTYADLTISTDDATIILNGVTAGTFTITGSRVTLIFLGGASAVGNFVVSGLSAAFIALARVTVTPAASTSGFALNAGGNLTLIEGQFHISTTTATRAAVLVRGQEATMRGIRSDSGNIDIASSGEFEPMVVENWINITDDPAFVINTQEGVVIDNHFESSVALGSGVDVLGDDNVIVGNHLSGATDALTVSSSGGDNVIAGNRTENGITDGGTGNTVADNMDGAF